MPAAGVCVTPRDRAMSAVPILRPAPAMRARLRRGLRVARRVGLPVLALAWALLMARIPYMVTIELSHLPPLLFPLAVALWALIFALPGGLFAASGVRPARRGRLAVACAAAVYGAMVVPQVERLLLETGDYLERGWIPPDDLRAQMTAGERILRRYPDPRVAALQSLAAGDRRVYVVHGLGVAPAGVWITPAAENRYGTREMPGFSDVGTMDPEVRAYQRRAACWVYRYNAVLARRLDGMATNRSYDPCARRRPS